MFVIEGRNVSQIYPRALKIAREMGDYRDSRNGPVFVFPTPVTTVYKRPWERVMLFPERDANPFFHLYESLWMLGGRQDVAPLNKFTSQMAQFAEDGYLHGAYGNRWRHAFSIDQLEAAVHVLSRNRDDRRVVLDIWSSAWDLDQDYKDIPCNLTITFQRNRTGELDMVVFCRSNDIVLGAYGANAVHMSMLQEYLAVLIGCQIGRYWQISVNWHLYEKDVLRPIPKYDFTDPYDGKMRWQPMEAGSQSYVDEVIQDLLRTVDNEIYSKPLPESLWARMCFEMFRANHVFRTKAAPERYEEAIQILSETELYESDWFTAGREWLLRRQHAWELKMDVEK